MWYLQPLQHAWRPNYTDLLKPQALLAEAVKDVAKALPGKRIYQRIRYVICQVCIRVGNWILVIG